MPSTLDRVVDATRAWLAPKVDAGTSTVVAFQQLCGVHTRFTKAAATSSPPTLSEPPAPTIRHRLLHRFFLAAAAAGNELFYIIFLPALFWLVSISLARRLLVVWGLVYFVGQSAKDLLRLPRPPSPPVTRLERHYETEYGFPSTHAMISLVLPCYSLAIQWRLGSEVNWPLGVLLCLAWCGSISLSRLYVGVHSVADLLGGLALGVFVLGVGLLVGEPVDAFVTQHAAAPIVAVAVSLVAVWSYPAPAAWTNAYGDTALIIAVVAGICCGQSAHFQRFPAIAMQVTGETLGQQVQSACGVLLCVMLRLLVGCTVLFLTRSLVKKATHLLWLPFVLPKYFAFCSLLPSPAASPISTTSASSNSSASASETEASPRSESETQTNIRVQKVAAAPQASATLADGSDEISSWDASGDGMRKRGAGAIADGMHASNGTGVLLAPRPRALKPVPPHQFRLSVEPVLLAPGRSRSASPAPVPSPLHMLLAPPAQETRHKLLPDPQDPQTTLVEFEVDGETCVINPLHVYLVEIPIKYITYWAVGFNATCTVPYLFNLLGV